ncbi:MAG: hypothetical protein ACW99G_01235 [Candidatus Thorarchaeota archaeon]|jgi:hypothetical protein
MTINANEILYVYSGGSGNSDPNESLGGDPSAFEITGTLNNLFNNVSNEEATSGNADYRCFYIFNNSLTETLYDASIFVVSQVGGGAATEIGITERDDQQRISMIQPVTGGSVTLDYDGTDFVWAFDSDLAVWATNLETSLNTLLALSTVTVVGSVEVIDGSNSNVFNIFFSDADGDRNHPLLELVSNDLTEVPDITIEKISEGAPKNFITTLISVDTAIPVDVLFGFTDPDNRLTIGDLLPSDGVAVWVKRTSLPGTQPLEGDGLTVRISGSAFS